MLGAGLAGISARGLLMSRGTVGVSGISTGGITSPTFSGITVGGCKACGGVAGTGVTFVVGRRGIGTGVTFVVGREGILAESLVCVGTLVLGGSTTGPGAMITGAFGTTGT